MRQYIHDHLDEYHEYNGQKEIRKTYSFELPDYKFLENEIVAALLNSKPEAIIVSINVGVTTCHPKDQYVKKVGRELADRNAKLIPFRVGPISMEPKDNDIKVSLHGPDFSILIALKKGFSQVRVLVIYEE